MPSPDKSSVAAFCRRSDVLLLVAGAVAAAAVRYPLLAVESADYHRGWRYWYDTIVECGYFDALRYEFADYNVPYLYPMALGAKAASSLAPWLTKVVVIKLIVISFSFVSAWFVYLCVRLKHGGSPIVPALAAVLALLWPTVVLTGALVGQSDAIYTAFLVACLYFLLAGRQALAFAAFGLAISFKLQAIFIAPLFLWLLFLRGVDWRCFALAPAVYLATLVPAWLAGRPFSDLVTIYYHEQFLANRPLTANAPSVYAWIPEMLFGYFFPWGVLVAPCLALLVGVLLYRSRAKATRDLTVFLAAYTVVLMPYVLPKMHDRYWYPAEIIGIVLAFYMPRFWYVPVGVSLIVYFNAYIIGAPGDTRVQALALLVLIVLMSKGLHGMLARPRQDHLARPIFEFVDGRRWNTVAALLAMTLPAAALSLRLGWADHPTAQHKDELLMEKTFAGTTRIAHAGDLPVEVYFDRSGGRLVYVKDQCERRCAFELPQRELVTFLHVVPADAEDLPEGRKQHGYDNLDFRMRNHLIDLHRTSPCVATTWLPHYEIAGIRTGEFSLNNNERLWEVYFTSTGEVAAWPL